MAGLGETCTHIAAVIFYLEAVARLQGKQTSTERKCEWIIPSYLKNVEYLYLSKALTLCLLEREKEILMQ